MRGKRERERTSRPNTQVSSFTTNDRTTTSTFPHETSDSGYTVSEPTPLTITIAEESVPDRYQSGGEEKNREQLFPRGRASQLTARDSSAGA